MSMQLNARPHCNRDLCRLLRSAQSETGAGEESRTLDLNLGKVALYQLSYSRTEQYHLLSHPEIKKEALFDFGFLRNPGAGEESRTLDLNLGKVALYQLSYSRVDNKRAL